MVRLSFGERGPGEYLEVWIGGSLNGGARKESYSRAEPGDLDTGNICFKESLVNPFRSRSIDLVFTSYVNEDLPE